MSVLKSIESGIEWLENKVLMKYLAHSKCARAMRRFAEQYLYKHCFLSCIFFLAVFTFLSFIPILVGNRQLALYADEAGAFDFFKAAVSSELYSKWLLVSVFVAIPMAVELVMDYRQLFAGKDEKVAWLASLLLATAFIGPAAITYCLLAYRGEREASSAQLFRGEESRQYHCLDYYWQGVDHCWGGSAEPANYEHRQRLQRALSSDHPPVASPHALHAMCTIY